MPANNNDEIRTAPVELYERLHGVDERIAAVRSEITEIQREYDRLRAHPDELAIDDLGPAMDPHDAATNARDYLTGIDLRLWGAQQDLDLMRGRYASRLKLTDAAAEDLDRRRTQRPRIERSR